MIKVGRKRVYQTNERANAILNIDFVGDENPWLN